MKQVKRLVFCTYPSIYSSIVLDDLLRSSEVNVVAIISSTRNLRVSENTFTSTLRRLLKSGFYYSIYLWLISQGHQFTSAFCHLKSVNTLAKKRQVPVFKTNNINNEDLKKTIQQLKPDYLLCAHFNQKITPEVYNLANISAINLHPSLLPDLKGVDPAFYALYEGYKETGVSLHTIDEEFDTGSTLLNQTLPIEVDDTLLSLNSKLFKAGAELCLSYFEDDLSKNTTPTKESYSSWPSKDQVKQFRKHRRLLSFQDIKGIFSLKNQVNHQRYK